MLCAYQFLLDKVGLGYYRKKIMFGNAKLNRANGYNDASFFIFSASDVPDRFHFH